MPAKKPNRIFGYARVSTQGQDLTYQLEKLKAAGCMKIFREKRSGKNTTERPELNNLLRSLKPDDLVLATVTDRLARDPLDLLNILQSVKQAGAGLRLLDEPFVDTTSEMGELVVFLIGWAARWQRQRILENTARGRELAKKRGVRFGRKPKLRSAQRQKVRELNIQGRPTSEIAKAFCVSKSTIQRTL